MSQENKITLRKKWLIISLIVIGILLIFSSSFSFENNSSKSKEYIEETEAKLEEFLLNVEGIRKVKVIITLESSIEAEENNGYYNKTDNTLPYVRGVVVACSNGSDDKIKTEVTEIVSKYLGIGANKVKITDIKR